MGLGISVLDGICLFPLSSLCLKYLVPILLGMFHLSPCPEEIFLLMQKLELTYSIPYKMGFDLQVPKARPAALTY